MAGLEHPAPYDDSAISSDWQRYQLFQIGRITVLASVLAAIAVIDQTSGTGPGIKPIVAVVALDLLLTAPYYWIGQRRKHNLVPLYTAVIYGDTCFVTAGEYLLGASAVYGLPIYMQLVVMAAALVPGRTAYGVALFGGLSYTAIMTGTNLGWLPMVEGPFPMSFADSWRWTTALSTVLATLTLAAIATSLSSAWRTALDKSLVLESELRELNHSLEERVTNATRSLAQRNEELSQTSRQINLFAQAITHDLRNPLTAAGEALEMVKQGSADDREELLTLSRENLLRADRMLMGLRDLMSTGRADVTQEMVDTEELLNELVSDLAASNTLQRARIVITRPIEPIVVGRVQLAHILRNLLNNALEHNSSVNGLEVEVSQISAEGEVTFRVRDNGRGVSSVIRDQVFSPFYRGTDTPHDGLGLGLALVNSLVTQLNGRIWIDPNSGKGATFCFSLPQPIETAEAN